MGVIISNQCDGAKTALMNVFLGAISRYVCMMDRMGEPQSNVRIIIRRPIEGGSFGSVFLNLCACHHAASILQTGFRVEFDVCDG